MTSIANQTRFRLAYQHLQQATYPVTAASLRATSRTLNQKIDHTGQPVPRERSPAENWSWKMWLGTIAVISFILCTELLNNILPVWYPQDPSEQISGLSVLYLLSDLLTLILPFAYGLFGSFAFLLRACNKRISNRSFDLYRIAEYKNRMMLGVVSGGGINLFISQVLVTNPDGATQLSASAVAFLAGYNTEYLFQLLERLSSAILPKTK